MTAGPMAAHANGSGADDPGVSRLECSGVTVRFGGLTALKDVDLAVPASSIVGLVGPNGAGKSTLFGVLSGLVRPTKGRVLLEGEDVTGARPQARAIRGLARTFQHPEIFSDLTVREHLVLAHRVRHARSRIWSDLFTMGSLRPATGDEASQVDQLIDILGLAPIAGRPALGLPLGSARLVELGRALACSPRVLLLDEPSSGLDSSETAQFEATLVRVARERAISVLLVEHDVELVMRMCSRIYVLDFGALIAAGTPAEVRADPTVRAAYLGEEVAAVPGPADEGPVLLADTTAPPGAGPEAATPAVQTSTALLVEDLDVRYGDAVVLTGVSFSVGAGEVLAVLGPNGAGKSSLARAVSGLVHPYSGRVVVDGHDVSSASAYRIRRAGVVHLPEGRGVFRSLSVVDNLKMAVSSIPGRQARRDALDLAFSTFPVLATRRRQLAGSLSGGEQQMLSLARALATSPRLLVADELSLGLAPKLVDLVFEGLRRARESGVSIVMIEQYVHRALAFADECLVLQRGALVWKGRAEDAGADLLTHYLGAAMSAS